MNKEKAIDLIQSMYQKCGFGCVEDNETGKALQFAIDYMKDEGEIVGWVNYYPDRKLGRFQYDKERADYEICDGGIQIPIRKPK